MRSFELVLLLLAIGAAVEPLARRFDVPLAIAQVCAGVLLSALPAVRTLHLDPALIFTLLVPPLLYRAAATSSLRNTRRQAHVILLLAVGLVLVTIFAVAVVTRRLLPALPWSVALVLGAALSPPDADVTTALARRLGIPERLITIIEGETLWNDTTALVSYKFAVQAVVVGAFALHRIWLDVLILAAGGLASGILVAWLALQIRRRVLDPVVGVTVSLLTPFAAYLLAERLHSSGVLAVVVTGFGVSRFLPRSVAPGARVRAYLTWEIAQFVIGGLVFMLLGVELGAVLPAFWREGHVVLLRAVLGVGVTLVIVRLAWVFGTTAIWRLFSSDRRVGAAAWRSHVVIGWAGLRGGDSMVMVLALPPITATGQPFPGRELITVVVLGVILLTLLGEGLSLRPLIRTLGLPDDHETADEERRARLEAARASLTQLRAVSTRQPLPRGLEAFVRLSIQRRTRLDLDDIKHAGGHDGTSIEDQLRSVEQETRNAARLAIVRMRDTNEIGDEALRRVLNDLDLEELREVDGS